MKSKIFDSITMQLQQHIIQYEESVETFDSNADIDENETRDMDEFSQQDEATDMKHRLEQPLEALKRSLLKVGMFAKNESGDVANTGSIVETSKAYYILDVSLPPLDVEGKKVLGVSAAAPFYLNIEGKKKGDQLLLGEEQQEILNVF